MRMDCVYLGDMRERTRPWPSDSVDMIFTDPPYTRKSIHLYGDLAALAARVLKPGHLLLCYCGALFLPEVFHALEERGEGLEWFWLFREHHRGGFPRMWKTHTLQAGKPILAWSKGKPRPSNWRWVVDEHRDGRRAKEHHPWQQDVAAALYYIEAYTLPGELVADPFVGSGTSCVAAKQLGCRYIGIDNDAAIVPVARKRLRETKVCPVFLGGREESER